MGDSNSFGDNLIVSLVDYAAATAGPSRSEIGDAAFTSFLADPNTDARRGEAFWGCATCDYQVPTTKPSVKFRGIIQRTDWQVVPVSPFNPLGGRIGGFGVKMTFSKITDGSSKTLLIGEKRLRPSEYQGLSTRPNAQPKAAPTFDDRGWADGWDYDVLRSTMFPIAQDGELPEEDIDFAYSFGSAHASGMNAILADGSGTFINYDIDREMLNRLGHRSDGETVVIP